MPAQPDFQQRLQSIERLLGEIEGAADPHLRTNMQELLRLVMDLHGAGLERLLELIRAADDGGAELIDRLGRDELTSSLLVLYGLHPLDLEARVAQAMDKLRARLRAGEGEVELLSIQDGAVRLRLRANGHGCGSGAGLREMVEEAIYQSAPDISSLAIEEAGAKQGFVPLEMLSGALSLAAADKG